jgi:hypothetical protein
MQLALAASNYNFGQAGHSPVPRKTGGPCSNPLRPKDPGVFERSHRFTSDNQDPHTVVLTMELMYLLGSHTHAQNACSLLATQDPPKRIGGNQWRPAGARNHRFGRPSGLRAHANAPREIDLL